MATIANEGVSATFEADIDEETLGTITGWRRRRAGEQVALDIGGRWHEALLRFAGTPARHGRTRQAVGAEPAQPRWPSRHHRPVRDGSRQGTSAKVTCRPLKPSELQGPSWTRSQGDTPNLRLRSVFVESPPRTGTSSFHRVGALYFAHGFSLQRPGSPRSTCSRACRASRKRTPGCLHRRGGGSFPIQPSRDRIVAVNSGGHRDSQGSASGRNRRYRALVR